MTQGTFEEFARRVSYEVVRLAHPAGTGEEQYIKGSIKWAKGTLTSLRLLLIIDFLPDPRGAEYLIKKARECERRLWDALQNRLLEPAE